MLWLELQPTQKPLYSKLPQLSLTYVLVDIVIQGEQDGITLAEQVHDRFQIPVIYLTAYVDDQTLARAKVTCPFGYILKPFNRNTLRATVEIALARHQAELADRSRLQEAGNPNETDNKPDLQSFEYLSLLSHELRNPISAIQLSTSMLGEREDRMDETKKQQLLQRIQSATASMTQLIEDVLTLGQTGHYTAPFNPDVTDIIEFCKMSVETFQWNAENRYTVSLSYSPESIDAEVDKKLLWHVLSNLLATQSSILPRRA